MLYPRVVVKTQPLQDLKPLAGLLGEISQSVAESKMQNDAFHTWLDISSDFTHDDQFSRRK